MMEEQTHIEQSAEVVARGITLKYCKKTSKSDKYSVDIISGVYEGGFKIWECEIDLLHFLAEKYRQQVAGQSVLEMGCGHGLLGILAHKLGARRISLQDYNQEVLEHLTKHNVKLNLLNEGEINGVEYLHGDWDKLKCVSNRFDWILGSQLIYNEQNYDKIIRFVKQFLSPQGRCLLANKHYYFGVGGNMPSFKTAVEKQGLHCTTELKILPLTGGNKKQIVLITW